MRSFRLSLCLAIISAVICSTYATAASSSHWNAYKQKELFLANDTVRSATLGTQTLNPNPPEIRTLNPNPKLFKKVLEV